MGLILISYHPAYDIYHCLFRQLLLLENLPGKKSAMDQLRILDFYLLFPSLLGVVRMPQTLAKRRTELTRGTLHYEMIEDPYKLFVQLERIQVTSTKLLASCELTSFEDVKSMVVQRTSKEIPSMLASAIHQTAKEQTALLSFLTGPFFDIDFYGPKGLKARTGLMEHRYDE